MVDTLMMPLWRYDFEFLWSEDTFSKNPWRIIASLSICILINYYINFLYAYIIVYVAVLSLFDNSVARLSYIRLKLLHSPR